MNTATESTALVAIWKLNELRFGFRVDGATLECVAHGTECGRAVMDSALSMLRAAGYCPTASASHISF